MLHYNVEPLIEAFLIKKSLFAFTNFESRHVCAEDINNMLRDLWTAGPLVPFSHGSKVPSTAIFASRIITKKSVQYRFSTFCSFKTLSLSISQLQKIFRNKLPLTSKNKKTQAPKFYFHSSKLKLAHETWFDSHSSLKTHMGNKKVISASLPKPQEHAITRRRETAYGYWAHPGQRSHISPALFQCLLLFFCILMLFWIKRRFPKFVF